MTTLMQNVKESLQGLVKRCVELVAKVRQRLTRSDNQQKQPESK
jgi:hypothetical protein